MDVVVIHSQVNGVILSLCNPYKHTIANLHIIIIITVSNAYKPKQLAERNMLSFNDNCAYFCQNFNAKVDHDITPLSHLLDTTN